MTNEKLALLIAEGDSEELLPILWEKMRKLFRLWANKFYTGHKVRCDLCGVTNDDLRQEGFFALLEAVKAYSNRPAEQKELKFSSFCHYPFKNRAAALIGMKTQQSRNEPLNDISRVSLDECLESSDGSESNNTLGDIIPDTAAELPFRTIENVSFASVVRQVVKHELADDNAALKVIEKHYYDGETYAQIGEDLGLTRSRIHQITADAMRILRKSRPLQELYYGNPYRAVSATAQQRDGSIVEQLVERRYELEQQRLKNRYESYFSQLSEAVLMKDYEILKGQDLTWLDEKRRKDDEVMYEALVAVMRSRQLLNS